MKMNNYNNADFLKMACTRQIVKKAKFFGWLDDGLGAAWRGVRNWWDPPKTIQAIEKKPDYSLEKETVGLPTYEQLYLNHLNEYNAMKERAHYGNTGMTNALIRPGTKGIVRYEAEKPVMLLSQYKRPDPEDTRTWKEFITETLDPRNYFNTETRWRNRVKYNSRAAAQNKYLDVYRKLHNHDQFLTDEINRMKDESSQKLQKMGL